MTLEEVIAEMRNPVFGMDYDRWVPIWAKALEEIYQQNNQFTPYTDPICSTCGRRRCVCTPKGLWAK